LQLGVEELIRAAPIDLRVGLREEEQKAFLEILFQGVLPGTVKVRPWCSHAVFLLASGCLCSKYRGFYNVSAALAPVA
jgi:hypothetical protein